MSENTAPSSPFRPASLLTIGVLLIALAGAFLIGLRVHKSTDPSITGVVTHGTGSVNAKPDQLSFTVTVSNTAAQTAGALDKTNKGIKTVMAALKRTGVDVVKDVQTTNLSLQPNYDYSGKTQRITGYTSSEDLQVLVRKLSAAGGVISAAATAAGNTATVQNISLSLANRSALVAQARTKAVQDSKKSAEALAKAAGRNVNELVYVEEVSASAPVMPQPQMYDSLAAGTASASPVPIAAGQQAVSITVKVRWSLS